MRRAPALGSFGDLIVADSIAGVAAEKIQHPVTPRCHRIAAQKQLERTGTARPLEG